ncbi:stage VI sporulation protein D [Bacillus sp. 7586-K]|nr:stage VI sporulation protein D [Bacillus sp. 7586-K]
MCPLLVVDLKGGIFLSQEQNQLRFSVEESVWFQKGQEVSDLLSISLDPDISIHEHDQYVSIRGALQLSGEYMIAENATHSEQFEYANVRYVNEVQTGEDGVSILTHRFPVDITIPRNRIDNLEEVYVSIESFDYEIPDIKCLKLVADLSISGIVNEQPRDQGTSLEHAEEEPFIEEEIEEEDQIPEPLYREKKEDPQDDPILEKRENPQDDPILEKEENPFLSLYHETSKEEDKLEKLAVVDDEIAEEASIQQIRNENDQETAQEKDEISGQQQEESVDDSQEDETEFNVAELEEEKLPSQETNDELFEPATVEVRQQQESVSEEPQEVQYAFFSKTEEEDEISEQQDDEENIREEDNTKDAHYLTSLFARDEEEDFTRVKMCIVQQGDTMEQICERYDISVQQLIRVNNFHADQDIYEGQILYIPDYSVSK